MKKKIFKTILSIVLAMTLMGNSIVFATDVANFSDGESNELEEVPDFISEEDIEIDTEEAVAGDLIILEYGPNPVKLGQYYKINKLRSEVGYPGRGYYLGFNVPEDGRVKVRIEDCYSELIADFYIPEDKYNNEFEYRGWDDVGTEHLDSGWFTVKPGEYILKFDAKKYATINDEAKVIVEYQKKGEFCGELEDNDTFDEALVIEKNVTYEGNYSKPSDWDIYKFTLDKPAKVDIQANDKSESGAYYYLYEEDEHGNVYEIDTAPSSRLRLGEGNYFVSVRPGTYDFHQVYTICVNVEEESQDAFEQERNDISSNANNKQVNTWYTGNLNNSGDVDYYKFVLDKPGKTKLEFKVKRQTYAGRVEATLFDKDLKEMVTLKNTENPYIASEERDLPCGEYYVRVRGKNYFKDDYSICLLKEKYKYVEQIIILEGDHLYEGEAGYLNVEILPEDAEYPILEWSSSAPDVISVEKDGFAVAKGTGTAILTACACDGSNVMVKKEFEVIPILDIAQMSFSKVHNYIYTGKYIEPLLEITDNGLILEKDKDYKITYKNNKNVGIASIIVTGIGDYCGDVTFNFAILPRGTNISSVAQSGNGSLKISWKKGTNITGYVIYRSTSKNGTYKKIKTITKSSTTSYVNSKLSGNKTYYYKIRTYKKAGGRNIYSNYSSVKAGKTKKLPLSSVKFKKIN